MRHSRTRFDAAVGHARGIVGALGRGLTKLLEALLPAPQPQPVPVRVRGGRTRYPR